MIGVALVVGFVLAKLGFTEWLERKYPVASSLDVSEELKADVNRIKLMLNIKTFNGGEKK